MNRKIKIGLSLFAIFILMLFTLKLYLDKTYLSEYERSSIAGSNRYETMVELNQKSFKKSKEAVLVSMSGMRDALSATPFASAKNIPIFFVEKDVINETIMKELKRLGVERVYIIGGSQAISYKVSYQLRQENIEQIERIAGANSFETSLLIAKKMCDVVDVKQLALVSYEGIADGVALASPASKNNMPIIVMKKSDRRQVVKFAEDQAIETTYFVGSEQKFPDDFADMMPNTKRINGLNRYETNIEIIRAFYDLDNIEKVYLTKGGQDTQIDFINTLSLSHFAANEDTPILFTQSSLGDLQKEFLKEINVNKFTEVGYQLIRPKIINAIVIKNITAVLIIILWIIAIKRVITL